MNRIALPLLVLGLAAGLPPSARAEDAPKPLALGERAPLREAKLRNVDGKDVTIASVAGKRGTLVVFTCNTCPWARLWQERVAEIGNAAVARGVGMIAINSNDPAVNAEDGLDAMKARAKSLGFTFPYAVDDNAREPESVKEAWLKNAVAAVAEGKAPGVGETKALGCSIKFRGKKTS